MKKTTLIGIILVTGFSGNAMAATGSARDAILFIGIIAGFLFLMAGFFAGIDFFLKNGKRIIRQTRTLVIRILTLNKKGGVKWEFYPGL